MKHSVKDAKVFCSLMPPFSNRSKEPLKKKKKKRIKTEAVITLLVKRIQCSVEHILEHKLDMKEQEPCPP